MEVRFKVPGCRALGAPLGALSRMIAVRNAIAFPEKTVTDLLSVEIDRAAIIR